MSSLLEQVRAKLLASAPVTDLVGQRIYPLTAPQGVARPYVVMTVVVELPVSTLTPDSGPLTSTDVQVDVYAERYGVADAAATAIADVMEALAGPAPELSAWRSSRRDIYEDDTQLFRVLTEYEVWR